MLKTVGADPSNEVLILTGTGPDFMMASDPSGFALEEADMEYWAYEYAYKDGRINVSALVNDVEIPTIGLLNGPGFHSEIVLMCDITLAASDAVLFDLHYDIGSVPADGIHNAFQELLGVKRAAYALLTGEAITAQQALEWGMVNEVVPRERLIPRAYEIADHIMTQPRTVRRLTTQIVRRPWKQRIVNDLDGGFGIQMFGHIAKKRAVHGDEHIRSTVDYVREGRKNNFDLSVRRRGVPDLAQGGAGPVQAGAVDGDAVLDGELGVRFVGLDAGGEVVLHGGHEGVQRVFQVFEEGSDGGAGQAVLHQGEAHQVQAEVGTDGGRDDRLAQPVHVGGVAGVGHVVHALSAAAGGDLLGPEEAAGLQAAQRRVQRARAGLVNAGRRGVEHLLQPVPGARLAVDDTEQDLLEVGQRPATGLDDAIGAPAS